MKVSALAGGVGGAKLLVGLQRVVDPQELTAVVNIGDDASVYGVHVSPDVDIVTYWLAGIADTDKGWGIRGDTFEVVRALGGLGVETWFSLGDRDFATCLLRTRRLSEGNTLSSVTHDIARALDVPTRILPASDDPVPTKIKTSDGRELPFQEYFVKERTEPDVAEVVFTGIEDAKPGPGVLEAIDDADVVVIAPSNPVLSILPIVELPYVKEALKNHPRVVAVSPIVGGKALKGPADRILQKLFGESSAQKVAEIYADWCDVFVIDDQDRAGAAAVSALGLEVASTDTIMRDEKGSERLARVVVETALGSGTQR